ncbi:hypothetical protein A2415_04760 [candidate division WWE3 bacterium RIFOXYC1_FULL_39_7]|uniref:Glycosyl transferase family 1 domain-containing protein n=2 Tax=Katanobacteria TaxID=422282 RepID=A0A1F4X6Z0_UNCKA|nr:MAG: hypothetical protein A2415_04760 [candidate division WWE3 bacterium RIFOXYC1_FULL_39_7]OGC77311.1 MAG: hypothetical protein A2619_04720 [candidate division WWE3 bacterium RIFOXYD1_FULL_39_9]
MKIAIVCDDLIQRGGQENVVEAVSELWPEADVFTPVATEFWVNRFKKRGVKVITSFMQVLPFKVKLNRFYSVFLFHILGIESFKLEDYELVFSISSRYAHHAITRADQIHICYMNSPGRMFWEPDSYFSPRLKRFLSYFLSYFRMADYTAARRVDFLIANSRNAQRRIKKYLNRESTIIYPFVDMNNFKETANNSSAASDYYLVITRLVAWKKVDLAIEACKRLNLKLKIIGVGTDMERLKSIANENIEFLGYADDIKVDTVRKCKALINTQLEDFGIVPLEAMAMGKAVIAYGKGGVTETIIEGKTGVFFEEQTVESLCETLKNFDLGKFSEEDCISRAKEFSKDVFNGKIKKLVNDLTSKNI